jgi:hypothetical protein
VRLLELQARAGRRGSALGAWVLLAVGVGLGHDALALRVPAPSAPFSALPSSSAAAWACASDAKGADARGWPPQDVCARLALCLLAARAADVCSGIAASPVVRTADGGHPAEATGAAPGAAAGRDGPHAGEGVASPADPAADDEGASLLEQLRAADPNIDLDPSASLAPAEPCAAAEEAAAWLRAGGALAQLSDWLAHPLLPEDWLHEAEALAGAPTGSADAQAQGGPLGAHLSPSARTGLRSPDKPRVRGDSSPAALAQRDRGPELWWLRGACMSALEPLTAVRARRPHAQPGQPTRLRAPALPSADLSFPGSLWRVVETLAACCVRVCGSEQEFRWLVEAALRVLTFAPCPGWRPLLLLALGVWVQQRRFTLRASQLTRLADLCVALFVEGQPDVLPWAEALADLLASRIPEPQGSAPSDAKGASGGGASFRAGAVFNFCRKKSGSVRVAYSSALLTDSAQRAEQLHAEELARLGMLSLESLFKSLFTILCFGEQGGGLSGAGLNDLMNAQAVAAAGTRTPAKLHLEGTQVHDAIYLGASLEIALTNNNQTD